MAKTSKKSRIGGIALAKKNRFSNILMFLSILGPGIITANAGNDAGGITTYATVGASYGYRMIWGLIVITISLILIQEMCARMGAVTGKGLSDLIRERFGIKLTFIAMLALLVTNIGITISEFAGIAAGLELFGISKYISVPIMAIVIWYLVTKGTYNVVEKVFILFSFAFFGYIISAFLAKPEWGTIFKQTATPYIEYKKGFIMTFIAMIGTTISPYMQFYLQASIVDKGITLKHYVYEKLDVIFGAAFGVIVQFFIIVSTGAVLHPKGIAITTAKQAALALKPLAGNYAFILFGLGLFGASALAAGVLPLTTSYAVCEAFGWESGLDNKFKEAPVFYTLYTALIAIGAAVILIPGISLIGIILMTQVIQGVLLPITLIFIILLASNKRIMGRYANSKMYNIISWITISVLILLNAMLLVTSVIG